MESTSSSSSHLEVASGDKDVSYRRQLRTSISLNLQREVGEGVGGEVSNQVLSPLNYQFLLRRPSAIIEEQMEVRSEEARHLGIQK